MITGGTWHPDKERRPVVHQQTLQFYIVVSEKTAKSLTLWIKRA